MWKETDNKLYRKFQFKNFSEAFAFMTRVALAAEKNGSPFRMEKCLEHCGGLALHT